MAPVHDAHTFLSTAAISHRYRLCIKNQASLPTNEKMSVGATMHQYQRCKANISRTRLPPTVLGRLLISRNGGYQLSTLPSTDNVINGWFAYCCKKW